MTVEVLFRFATLVFVFLLLGVGLTLYEFKYFILGQKSPKKVKKSSGLKK